MQPGLTKLKAELALSAEIEAKRASISVEQAVKANIISTLAQAADW
jgi:hypothetical protein